MLDAIQEITKRYGRNKDVIATMIMTEISAFHNVQNIVDAQKLIQAFEDKIHQMKLLGNEFVTSSQQLIMLLLSKFEGDALLQEIRMVEGTKGFSRMSFSKVVKELQNCFEMRNARNQISAIAHSVRLSNTTTAPNKETNFMQRQVQKCYNCGGVGHLIRQCPSLPRTRFEDQQPLDQRIQQSGQQSYVSKQNLRSMQTPAYNSMIPQKRQHVAPSNLSTLSVPSYMQNEVKKFIMDSMRTSTQTTDEHVAKKSKTNEPYRYASGGRDSNIVNHSLEEMRETVEYDEIFPLYANSTFTNEEDFIERVIQLPNTGNFEFANQKEDEDWSMPSSNHNRQD